MNPRSKTLAVLPMLVASLTACAAIAAEPVSMKPISPTTLSAERLSELTTPGSPRVYTGDELASIAMPVGGILAGQLYFKGDGRLAHWDIMNGRAFGSSPLVRPAADLEQGFAVRVRDDAGRLVSFPLTLETFPDTTFTSDYPAGVVRYEGATNFPLAVTLEGIAPFVPLDAAGSGIPATFLRSTVKNTGDRPVEGDVLGGDFFLGAHAGDLGGGEGDEGEVEAGGRGAAPLADDADEMVELDVDGAGAEFGHGEGCWTMKNAFPVFRTIRRG